MFESYRAPRDYMPFWHIGARMGIGTVRRFLAHVGQRRRVRKLLDVGTGGGANVFLASWLGFRVTACDLSFNGLRALRAMGKRVRPTVSANVVQADAYTLPFPDGAFDVIIASHVIEHMQLPEILLQECGRVLRGGGVLRVSCPSHFHKLRIGRWFGLKLDPEDHVVLGYGPEAIARCLPRGMSIRRVSYQGRFIESNVADLQFVLSRKLGMSGNPATTETATTTRVSFLLWLIKECALLPLLALARIEDVVFFFMTGSMVSVEIEKRAV